MLLHKFYMSAVKCIAVMTYSNGVCTQENGNEKEKDERVEKARHKWTQLQCTVQNVVET